MDFKDKKVAIVDVDLFERKKHRFPNLVCEKISAYFKEKGASVTLESNYHYLPDLFKYDYVFVAKVFTDTEIPDCKWLDPKRIENTTSFRRLIPDFKNATETPMGVPAYFNISVEQWMKRMIFCEPGKTKIYIGGTGFFFDKAFSLPTEIEHHMPDYHLYDDWIEEQVLNGSNRAIIEHRLFNETVFRSQFKEYTDFSIGFLTRGCFRKCKFCVNQKYNRVFIHSPLSEFYDPERKKICMLDDNFFGGRGWKPLFEELVETNKPFKFKQGLDERLLTDEICKSLFSAKYSGDFTFAFDNIADYNLIHRKLKMIRKYTDVIKIKFYVLVGFESTDIHDIENAFKRIALLMKYRCLPYIMRYQNKNEMPWKNSEYREAYVTLARWCNQPGIFKKMSFRNFCERDQFYHKTDRLCASMRALKKLEAEDKELADTYFDMRFDRVFINRNIGRTAESRKRVSELLIKNK